MPDRGAGRTAGQQPPGDRAAIAKAADSTRFLPKPLAATLNLEALEPAPTSFIDPEFAGASVIGENGCVQAFDREAFRSRCPRGHVAFRVARRMLFCGASGHQPVRGKDSVHPEHSLKQFATANELLSCPSMRTAGATSGVSRQERSSYD